MWISANKSPGEPAEISARDVARSGSGGSLALRALVAAGGFGPWVSSGAGFAGEIEWSDSHGPGGGASFQLGSGDGWASGCLEASDRLSPLIATAIAPFGLDLAATRFEDLRQVELFGGPLLAVVFTVGSGGCEHASLQILALLIDPVDGAVPAVLFQRLPSRGAPIVLVVREGAERAVVPSLPVELRTYEWSLDGPDDELAPPRLISTARVVAHASPSPVVWIGHGAEQEWHAVGQLFECGVEAIDPGPGECRCGALAH